MLLANRHFKCLTNPKPGTSTNPVESGQRSNRCVVLPGDIAECLTTPDAVSNNFS